MAVTYEGVYPGKERNPGHIERLNTTEKVREPFEIEHRPDHAEVGSRLDFVFKPAKLFIRVKGIGIKADADQEVGLRAKWIPVHVEPAVQIAQNIYQPDRVHIENRRCRRERCKLWRIARHRPDVPDTQSECAQQVGLKAEHVAAPATEVQQSFDSCLLLHYDCERLRAHSCGGAGAVRDVNGIDSVALRVLSAFHLARRVAT